MGQDSRIPGGLSMTRNTGRGSKERNQYRLVRNAVLLHM